jgi:hypothetical protein
MTTEFRIREFPVTTFQGGKFRVAFTAVLALGLIVLCQYSVAAQKTTAPFGFHSGQSMYIVAFHCSRQQVLVDAAQGTMTQAESVNLELGMEREVRKRIEQWGYFKVAEKPSDADFVFLVSVDDAAIEGLAISFDAYRGHFKGKFDLDALRDAAYARYLAGPLKLASPGRLTDRLIKDFRAKVDQSPAHK